VREVVTVSELVERSFTRERLVARLVSSFGILALLLAGLGLYGVMAYSVSRRLNEFGVRIALGAAPGAVSWLVLRETLQLVVPGLVLGLLLWFPVLGLARGLVYGLSPHDPVSVFAGTGILLVVAVTAALIPAMRAARVDPIDSIRAE
jgi:ABC-type antimicrobial peptide transport system permease subunit